MAENPQGSSPSLINRSMPEELLEPPNGGADLTVKGGDHAPPLRPSVDDFVLCSCGAS